MWSFPQQISAGGERAVSIPAGVVVGYDDTIASLAAYPDWAICDGTNDTPDLTDRFIIGADETDYLAGTNGGSLAGAVTGTTSADGAHGNVGGLSSGPGSWTVWYRGLGGEHSHALSGDLPGLPPSRRLVFIKSSVQSKLPPRAVIWRFDADIPAKFGAFSDLAGRFALGVGDDSRDQTGSDIRTVTLAVATAGDHIHPPSVDPGASGSYTIPPTRVSGGHVHPDFSEDISVPKPPFLALAALVTTGETDAAPMLVLAYDGLLADLPEEWAVCDGAAGTPDLRGRLPIGVSATLSVGDAGGQSTPEAISGSSSVQTVVVNHHHYYVGENHVSNTADHQSYDWTHGHASWSGTVDPMPPWHALHFIMAV